MCQHGRACAFLGKPWLWITFHFCFMCMPLIRQRYVANVVNTARLTEIARIGFDSSMSFCVYFQALHICKFHFTFAASVWHFFSVNSFMDLQTRSLGKLCITLVAFKLLGASMCYVFWWVHLTDVECLTINVNIHFSMSSKILFLLERRSAMQALKLSFCIMYNCVVFQQS